MLSCALVPLLALLVPQVHWSDVGGCEAAKQILMEVVVWPQQHAALYAKMGIDPPRGVLLYGPWVRGSMGPWGESVGSMDGWLD